MSLQAQSSHEAPAEQGGAQTVLALAPALHPLDIACNARLEQELGADAWAALTLAQQAAERNTLRRLIEESDETGFQPDEMVRRGYTYGELNELFPPLGDDAKPAVVADARAPASSIFVDLVERYRNRGKERPWSVEGAIEGKPTILWVGPEKSGKSWTAMQLCIACIMGTTWLGKFQVKRPGPVVYFDSEYGPDEFARRIARIVRGTGGADEQVQHVLSRITYIYSGGLKLVPNDPQYKAAAVAVRRLKPSLIVVDPLRNHLEAGANENDSAAATAFGGCLKVLRDAGECPVLVLHHVNKGGKTAGSRAFTGLADLIIEGTDVDVPQYTARGRTVRPSDPISGPFSITIEHCEESNGDEDAMYTRVTYAGADAAAGGSAGKPKSSGAVTPAGLDPLEAKIWELLAKQGRRDANASHESSPDGPRERLPPRMVRIPLAVSYIAKAVGRSNEDVKNAVHEMTEAGHLEEAEEGHVYRGRRFDAWRLATTPIQTPIQTAANQDVWIDAIQTSDEGGAEDGVKDAESIQTPNPDAMQT